jgi:cell division protein FtsL
LNTKVKKILLTRESEYSLILLWLLYAVLIFSIVSVAFLMAKHIVNYSIQMDMLKNKIWNLKTQESLLNQQIHNIKTEVDNIYFKHSKVIYIGDKAFSIFNMGK